MRAIAGRPRIDRGTHRTETFQLLLDGAADVGLVVSLAGRDDEIDGVDAGGDGALGAFEVRHQRTDGGGFLVRERMHHDDFDIGKLRNDLRRHERAGVDLAHPGRDDGVDQRAFRFSGNEHIEVLQAVTRTGFADMDVWRVRHRFDPPWGILLFIAIKNNL